MKNQVAVSVIVPVYNAEKVIGKCLDSILMQSLKKIEVLVVDDGSKDGTRAILQKIANRDSRVKLILKDKNEGVSAARNSAISIAEGEYLGFVDADDWIESDYLEALYRRGQNADVIVAGYQHDTMDAERNTLVVNRNVCMNSGYWDDKKSLVTQAAHIDTAKMFAYIWNKLYKREIVIENGLVFPKQNLNEDFIFNIKIWDEISTLSIIESMGYHYIKSSKDSLTQKFIPDFLEIMDSRFEYIKTLLVNNGVYQGKAKEELANIYIKHAIAGVARNCAKESGYDFKEQYLRVKSLLQYKNAKEASKFARGNSKQEKVCNLVFKSRIPLIISIFGKLIYFMQTKSQAFDKLK